MATLLVIEHVPHERLGTFEDAFREADLRVMPLRVFERAARWPSAGEFDGVVSMGGPMSVYQPQEYPFISKELALLRAAVKAGTPVLGVCLGAQLLAAALGAPVKPAAQKEIGWYPLMREPAAEGDPLFEAFGSTETVFQWHGDTFGLPRGAVRLAASPLCPEQAFRYGASAYGLQFHVEVTEAMIRAWMRNPGNRRELAALKGQIDPLAIRRQSPAHVERLAALGRGVARAFGRLVAGAPAARVRRKAVA
jgi:GMP synthase (glutamine-hydrolysing)